MLINKILQIIKNIIVAKFVYVNVLWVKYVNSINYLKTFNETCSEKFEEYIKIIQIYAVKANRSNDSWKWKYVFSRITTLRLRFKWMARNKRNLILQLNFHFIWNSYWILHKIIMSNYECRSKILIFMGWWSKCKNTFKSSSSLVYLIAYGMGIKSI